ncbi:MAG: PAS domain S-box protein [Saprospiraceae bacterium]
MKTITDENNIGLLKQLQESERRLRTMILLTPALMAILRGMNHVVEIVNPRSLEIWGRTEEEVLNKPILDAMPELKTQGFKEILDEVYTTGNIFSVSELEVSIKRGGRQETIYVNTSWEPLYNSSGEIDGIMAAGIDVTEQVTARKKIKESEERFRAMADNIPNLAWMAQADGWIYWYNKKWYDYTGTTPDQMVGWGWQSVHDASVLPDVLVKWVNSIELGEKFEMVFPLLGADGNFRQFLTRVLPVHDEQGKIVQWFGSNTDITEQVEARKKIEASEEFNRTVLESSPDCLKILDTEGRVQYMNFNGLCQMEIDDFSHFKSKHWWSFWGKENEQIVKNAIDKALSGKTAQFIAYCPTAKGTPKWWDVIVSPIGKGDGSIHQIISVSRDITTQKNTDLAISESEKKFRLLADSMPQHIWTADLEGNLNYYNQSVFDYTGLSLEQINKDGWIQIVHPDDREGNIKEWIESVTTGKDFLFEHRFRRYDGIYRWQLSRAIPQRDESGAIRMWVGTSTDIQKQKTFAETLEIEVHDRTKELAQNNIELAKMNKELQSFAYISSHDLQEPLRKIQTFASRIAEKEEENLSENGKDLFKRVRASAERMQSLIDDLLTYSRTHTLERDFKKVNLNDVIDIVKHDLKDEIDQKHATITTREICDLNIIHFQFQQLFYNLVSNSLKFSNPEHHLHIIISCEHAKGSSFKNENLDNNTNYCHITVEDNGIGFEPQYNEKIFELFQRLHGKDEYQGTGIGLAIVKRIVENHNGIITANGELNKGAIFDIYLPVDSK